MPKSRRTAVLGAEQLAALIALSIATSGCKYVCEEGTVRDGDVCRPIRDAGAQLADGGLEEAPSSTRQLGASGDGSPSSAGASRSDSVIRSGTADAGAASSAGSDRPDSADGMDDSAGNAQNAQDVPAAAPAQQPGGPAGAPEASAPSAGSAQDQGMKMEMEPPEPDPSEQTTPAEPEDAPPETSSEPAPPVANDAGASQPPGAEPEAPPPDEPEMSDPEPPQPEPEDEGPAGDGVTLPEGDWFCLQVGESCTCIQQGGVSGDQCLSPKPTCCFTLTTNEVPNCLCLPEDSADCQSGGPEGAVRIPSCPPQ